MYYYYAVKNWIIKKYYEYFNCSTNEYNEPLLHDDLREDFQEPEQLVFPKEPSFIPPPTNDVSQLTIPQIQSSLENETNTSNDLKHLKCEKVHEIVI
jgi:hypothetical protein